MHVINLARLAGEMSTKPTVRKPGGSHLTKVTVPDLRLIQPVIRQSVALPEHIVNFVHPPLAPPRRQAGTHGGHAGWLLGFEGCVALGLPAHKAAGLGRKIVESADECVQALGYVGGVEGLGIQCRG